MTFLVVRRRAVKGGVALSFRVLRSLRTQRGPRTRLVCVLGSMRTDWLDDALDLQRFWQHVDTRLATVDATSDERARWRAKIEALVPRPDAHAIEVAHAEMQALTAALAEIGAGSTRRRWRKRRPVPAPAIVRHARFEQV
jgi:hypothetical protein